jgi:hypothetical protein
MNVFFIFFSNKTIMFIFSFASTRDVIQSDWYMLLDFFNFREKINTNLLKWVTWQIVVPLNRNKKRNGWLKWDIDNKVTGTNGEKRSNASKKCINIWVNAEWEREWERGRGRETKREESCWRG